MTSFRSSKKCANCNADLKSVSQRQAVDVFNIYQPTAGSYEQTAAVEAPSGRFVKTIETPAEPRSEVRDFELNLSDADTYQKPAPPPPPVSAAVAAVASEAASKSAASLGEEEIEVEGLGFESGEPSAEATFDIEEPTEIPVNESDLKPEPVASQEPEPSLEVEEAEAVPPISLDFNTAEEAEISLEVEEPETSFSLDLGEPDHPPSPEIPSLDLGEEPAQSIEPETDPRLSIPDLDLGEEPQLTIEPEIDPRNAIEDLDLTLEIEEPPPPKKTKTPDASLDGIKLEIEKHPDEGKD